jgi:glutamate formiminotransferase/formiminotetrahydrofolate cyclodeaminase
VLALAPELLNLAHRVVEGGNPNSLSDGGVAALTALAAAEGAYYNVLINLQAFEDEGVLGDYKIGIRRRAQALIERVRAEAEAIRQATLAKLS